MSTQIITNLGPHLREQQWISTLIWWISDGRNVGWSRHAPSKIAFWDHLQTLHLKRRLSLSVRDAMESREQQLLEGGARTVSALWIVCFSCVDFFWSPDRGWKSEKSFMFCAVATWNTRWLHVSPVLNRRLSPNGSSKPVAIAPCWRNRRLCQPSTDRVWFYLFSQFGRSQVSVHVNELNSLLPLRSLCRSPMRSPSSIGPGAVCFLTTMQSTLMQIILCGPDASTHSNTKNVRLLWIWNFCCTICIKRPKKAIDTSICLLFILMRGLLETYQYLKRQARCITQRVIQAETMRFLVTYVEVHSPGCSATLRVPHKVSAYLLPTVWQVCWFLYLAVLHFFASVLISASSRVSQQLWHMVCLFCCIPVFTHPLGLCFVERKTTTKTNK